MYCAVELDRERLGRFCRQWKIDQFSLFGSVLRSDFRTDSDVDCLVAFAGDSHWTLFDLVRMQQELEEQFGRRVHLVSRRGLEASRNHLRREAILSSAEVVSL